MSTENEKTAVDAEERAAEDQLDTIQPNKDPKTWTFEYGEVKRAYVQKPLGYFAKLRLFALAGKAIRRVLQAGGPEALSDLFGGGLAGMRGNQLGAGDFNDAAQMIELVAAAAEYVPDFFEDAYCWILGVPIDDRETAKALMTLPPDEGGLTDEQGVEILKLFIAQNWEAITDFFGRHFREIVETARQQTEEAAAADTE